MKIVLVIPTLKQGGAERVMSELANIWAENGHNVHMIVWTTDRQFYNISKKITLHDLKYTNKSIYSKSVSQIKLFFKLRKLLIGIEADFVMSFITMSNILTILSSSFLDQKVFVSDRFNPRKHLPVFRSVLRKILYKKATGIIAQTNLAKELLKKDSMNHNIVVIPNPLKDTILSTCMKKEKIILNIGRLVEEKGQKYLMESFSRLRNADNWQLVILGDGPLRVELSNLSIRLGIKDRVYMPGSVKNVDDWYTRSSIFAFSSISEGFPNALVEAMSTGLPVVSFDCDTGPRDSIDNAVNGFLVDVFDMSEFGNKIDLLIKDKTLREKLSTEAMKIRLVLSSEKISKMYLDFCTQYSNCD